MYDDGVVATAQLLRLAKELTDCSVGPACPSRAEPSRSDDPDSSAGLTCRSCPGVPWAPFWKPWTPSWAPSWRPVVTDIEVPLILLRAQ